MWTRARLTVAAGLLLAGCGGGARSPANATAVVARPLTAVSATPDGVDTPVLGPAPGVYWPRVAVDGPTRVVAWEDDRGAGISVAVARVDDQGHLLDPEGIVPSVPAGDRAYPDLACHEGTCLLVYQYRGGAFGSWRIRGVRLDRAGRLLDAADLVLSPDGAYGEPGKPAVAFAGGKFVVAWWVRDANELRAVTVPPAGPVPATTPQVLVKAVGMQVGDEGYPPAVAVGGGNLLFAWSQRATGSSDIRAARVTPALTVLDTPSIAVIAGQASASQPVIAGDDAGFLVAWQEAGTVALTAGLRARRLGADGVPVGAPFPVAGPAMYLSTGQVVPSAADYLVSWSEGTADGLRFPAVRVGRDGTIRDATPLTLGAAGETSFLDVAATPDGFFAARGDRRNGVVTLVGVRLSPAWRSLDPNPVLVARSFNRQEEPAVGSDGSGYLVAWTDRRDGGGRIYGAILDRLTAPASATAFPVSEGAGQQGQVAVASSGSAYLVVWNEAKASGGAPLVGRRFSMSGQPLGPEVTLAANGVYGARVAYADGVYLAVGTDYRSTSSYGLAAVRVSDQGQPLDATPLSLATGPSWPSVASDGSTFLVAWDGGDTINGVHLDKSGAVLGAPLVLSPPGTKAFGQRPSLAFGISHYLLIWEDLNAPAIRGVRLHPDGTPVLTATIDVVGMRLPLRVDGAPTVTFDGANFDVIWRSALYDMNYHVVSEDLRAAVVDPTGTPAPSRVVTSLLAYKGVFEGAALAGATSERRAVTVLPIEDSLAGYLVPRVHVHAISGAPVELGGRCGSLVKCAAGTCVDGVCCDGACGGGGVDCQACSLPAGAARNGVCGPVGEGRSCGKGGICALGACASEPADAQVPDTGRDAGTVPSGPDAALDGASAFPDIASAADGTAGALDLANADGPTGDAGVPISKDASGGAGGAAPGTGGAGGSGGGGGQVDQPTASVRGCGCHLGSPRTPAPIGCVALVSLVLVLARRARAGGRMAKR
jgi:hypothetical protein